MRALPITASEVFRTVTTTSTLCLDIAPVLVSLTGRPHTQLISHPFAEIFPIGRNHDSVPDERFEVVVHDNIIPQIRKVLIATTQVRGAEDLPTEQDLYAVGLDSMGAVNMLIGLETEFDLTVPDAQLNRESIKSIANIATLISSLKETEKS